MQIKDNITYLPLKLMKGHLKLRSDVILPVKDEIELFLQDKSRIIGDLAYAKSAMFSYEIKANNAIEGYNDGLDTISEVIKSAEKISDHKQRQRILNLYHGYQFILDNDQFNRESLIKLYRILSMNILDPFQKKNTSQYYRTAPVYVYKTARMDFNPTDDIEEKYHYETVPVENIEQYMEQYFELANDNSDLKDMTDIFIRSQLLHFYFVYIHPFMDVNGRTSRTMAMNYLLKHQAYPFITFNRAIVFDRRNYERALCNVRDYRDISYFLKYMLLNVKRELEKWCTINNIAESSPGKLSTVDFQTLEYFLSLKGMKTIADFAAFYRNLNEHQKTKDIYETMLVPLIEKGILEIERDTNKLVFDGIHNKVLRLNNSRIENPSSIIK